MSLGKEYKGKILPGLICQTGVDNCGKTIQVNKLIERFKTAGVDVVLSKAYGPEEKATWGKWVDGALVSKNPLADEAVTWLFHFLHKAQVAKAIKDVNEGKIVVADRWDESFIVYHNRNLPMSERPAQLKWMWDDAFLGLIPETTLFHDIDPALAQARSMRGKGLNGNDGFDDKAQAYHKAMFHGFHELAELRSWSMIDAIAPIDAVSEQIWSIVAPIYAHGLVGSLE